MKPRNAYCSFCRKDYQVVGPLVEGPDNVYICGECVSLCQSIIDQEKRRRSVKASDPTTTDVQPFRATLDKLIPNQERAKAMISEAACRLHEEKVRVLLITPSQSAAKYFAKAVAFALDVPFAAGDAGGLLKPGEKNLFFDLLNTADFDAESAQRGVVFVGGMENPEAQDALSTIWRGSVIDLLGGLTMDVRGLLFICGATYVGLDESIGPPGENEQPISVKSLEATGARSEWCEALTAIARLPQFDEESLGRIVNWIDFRRA
jgi:ATP-dependent Clp protease ATP-binding subunit ClpX